MRPPSLEERPKHDYVPLLLAGLTEPVKSQFSITVGHNGVVQYTHAIQQENANQRAVECMRIPLCLMCIGRCTAGTSQDLQAGFVMAQLNQAQQAAVNTEIQREQTNFQLTEANRRVFQALEAITDQQLPRQPQAWWQWWQQYNQYDWPKPTQWAYQSIPRWYYGGLRASCFLAGTLVRAQAGLVPIESLHAGDRVLSQDQDTGELAYKLVVRTTIRPPSAMTRIKTIREEHRHHAGPSFLGQWSRLEDGQGTLGGRLAA